MILMIHRQKRSKSHVNVLVNFVIGNTDGLKSSFFPYSVLVQILADYGGVVGAVNLQNDFAFWKIEIYNAMKRLQKTFLKKEPNASLLQPPSNFLFLRSRFFF